MVQEKTGGRREGKRTKGKGPPPPPLERLDDDWFDLPAAPWSEPLLPDEPSTPALAGQLVLRSALEV